MKKCECKCERHEAKNPALKFWFDYMDRNPFLAMSWMRNASYTLYGDYKYEY